MQLQKLLTELLTVDSIDCWENAPVAVLIELGVVSVAWLTVQLPMGSAHAALERDTLIPLTLLVLLAFGPGRFAIGNRLPHPNPFSRSTRG